MYSSHDAERRDPFSTRLSGLLTHVVQYLDIEDLLPLRLVSKFFQSVVDEPYLWEWELERLGYDDLIHRYFNSEKPFSFQKCVGEIMKRCSRPSLFGSLRRDSCVAPSEELMLRWDSSEQEKKTFLWRKAHSDASVGWCLSNHVFTDSQMLMFWSSRREFCVRKLSINEEDQRGVQSKTILAVRFPRKLAITQFSCDSMDQCMPAPHSFTLALRSDLFTYITHSSSGVLL
jgi:hypothetical protein